MPKWLERVLLEVAAITWGIVLATIAELALLATDVFWTGPMFWPR